MHLSRSSCASWTRSASCLALLLIGILAAACLTGAAATEAIQDAPAPYSMDLAWYDTWLAEQQAAEPSAGGRRSLAGKTSNSGTCNVQLDGTGGSGGVSSLKISCSGNVQILVGNPIWNYYQSHRGNFKGVTISAPQQAYSSEVVLFFINQKITLTGYARNVHVDQWAITHFEQGADATLKYFEFSNNKGYRFPTVAAARGRIRILHSSFNNNVCTASSCHTGGVYVTEGQRLSVINSKFTGNRGNLAGAMMITSGATATVTGSTFTENSTPNYGQFAGAILNDWCTDSRAQYRTQIKGNKFLRNKSNGFGGAIRLGTSQGGGCPDTVVKGNTFAGNRAAISGGAIYLAYCNGQRTNLEHNKFSDNVGAQFPGHITSNQGQCPTPDTYGSTFSNPSFIMSAARYFP